ncbi:MAG: lipolytic protein family [Marmoricola sp.]|nr:lipolytic protein family [Marmoricola sp.]
MIQRATFAGVAASVLGAALVAGVTPPAEAAGEAPLRILLSGDSITQGFNGDFTWRYRIAKEFARQRVDVDFVGSRRTPVVREGWSASRYADPNFDSDHFAQVGTLLQSQVSYIGAEIRKQQPDLVVLECGVNDMRHGASPQETDTSLRNWISAARSAKPDLRIVLSPVLSATDSIRPGLTQVVAQYDTLMAETAATLTTADSPITVADTTRGWSLTQHTYDNLHPNPTGETLIAQRIGETLHDIGVLPAAPNLYRTTAWTRPVPLRAVVRGRRVTLAWDNQATTGARLWSHRVGHASQLSSTVYRGASLTTGELVPGATYEFRMQVFRGRMSSPLGQMTRITLPAGVRKPAAVARVVVDGKGVHWTRSTGATSYTVKFKRLGRKAWITRRTGALSIDSARVVRAKVWAVNAGGRSAVRVANR